MPEFASRRAHELAADLGVDAATVTGTGRDGRVTAADVRDAARDGAPDGFGDAARALWRSVTAGVPDGWELDERELEILSLAARQADDLAQLEAVVDRDGALTVGSQGQPVVHPALLEARQARLAISRLLGQLGLPDETGSRGTEASRRGQHAARARWAGRGARDHAQLALARGDG